MKVGPLRLLLELLRGPNSVKQHLLTALMAVAIAMVTLSGHKCCQSGYRVNTLLLLLLLLLLLIVVVRQGRGQ